MSIIYLDQTQLWDPRLPDLSTMSQHDWHNFRRLKEQHSFVNSLYCRAGVNNLPFKNPSVLFDSNMPNYDPGFGLTFDEVTDQRAHDLTRTHKDKPWLIMYSGGIDSTVIIVSLLKNLSAADRACVTIACNQLSIIENPKFFYDHILPNFATIDSTDVKITSQLLKNYYVFDGYPADQLYGPGVRFLRGNNDQDALRDWRKDPDGLIHIMSQDLNLGHDCATWYYDKIKENLLSTPVPATTYYDFLWWTVFNNVWTSVIFRPMHVYQTRIDLCSTKEYLDNYVPWYATANYQLWAMNNHAGIKYCSGIAQRKLASKKYIFDFDQNEYYLHFKLKMASVSRKETKKYNSWFCLTDTDERLYLDTDLHKILELLPAHINRS